MHDTVCGKMQEPRPRGSEDNPKQHHANISKKKMTCNGKITINCQGAQRETNPKSSGTPERNQDESVKRINIEQRKPTEILWKSENKSKKSTKH